MNDTTYSSYRVSHFSEITNLSRSLFILLKNKIELFIPNLHIYDI